MLADLTSIGAIATACAGLLALVLWFLKRKNEPTPQQRRADRAAEIDQLQRTLAAARSRGDHAAADAVLRRLSELE